MRHITLVALFTLCQIHAGLADNETSCEDISIKLEAPGYTIRCEARQSPGQASSRVHVLDAASDDNKNFLYAVKIIAREGFYFIVPDFKEAFTQDFSQISIRNWTEGHDVDGFDEIAEFSGTVSGVDSTCLAFKGRSLRSPGGGGYSRYSYGVTCTSTSQSPESLYSLLQQLKL